MAIIKMRFKTPDTGEFVPGSAIVQLKALPNAKPLTDGQDAILTDAREYDVPASGAEITTRATPFGWYYHIEGVTETGWKFHTNVYVPNDDTFDLDELVTLDPRAPFGHSRPEPQWWSAVEQLTETYAEGVTEARDRAETAADGAKWSEDAAHVSATAAEVARQGAKVSRDTAVAAADAAGGIRVRATFAEADADAETAEEGAWYRVVRDETRGSASVFYRLESGTLVEKLFISKDHVSPEEFGAKGDGVTDDAEAFALALMSGLKVVCQAGAEYAVSGVTLADAVPVECDLNGATVIGTGTGTTFTLFYPYGEARTVGSVSLSARSITMGDTSGFEPGDRVKMVSQNRTPGMRPSTGNREYWQGQYLTVGTVTLDGLTFIEAFEADYNFATNPRIMKVNPGTLHLHNGKLKHERGHLDTRSNVLLSVRGGTGHKVNIKSPNSNGTAIGFRGCDSPEITGGWISNVGRVGDTSGGHGVSFTACNNPRIAPGTKFHRVRHAFTTNDTEAEWATQDYYSMGPSYDIDFDGVIVSAASSSALSTHHGVRRGKISDCTVVDSVEGAGIRGWGIALTDNQFEKCDRAVFIFSEESVATADRTTGTYVSGVRTTSIKNTELQVQRTGQTTLGRNSWRGGATAGWFLNVNDQLILQGENSFWSNAALGSNGNYLHCVETPVSVRGSLTANINTMTLNGTNNAIYMTGAHAFNANGPVVIEAPTGISSILRQITAGSSVRIENLLYRGPTGNPITSSGTIRQRYRDIAGSRSSAYFFITINTTKAVTLQGVLDPNVTVLLNTNGNNVTLESVSDGQFTGQRLAMRRTGGGSIIVPGALSNVTLVSGSTLTIADQQSYTFVWTGSSWNAEQ